MSNLEDKWKANRSKVSFARQFPGLLAAWSDLEGKQIRRVIPLEKHPGAVLIMEDRTWAVVPNLDPDPAPLQEGIHRAKDVLEGTYRAAYEELERLTAVDRELTRKSRKENILGAIRNNLDQIPELKEEIQALLSRLPE
jgi:diglucosylglycerate octanoyltransferase